MTFSQAYSLFGNDVEKIAMILRNVEPWMIDRLINRAMERRYQRQKLAESLREIRRRHA